MLRLTAQARYSANTPCFNSYPLVRTCQIGQQKWYDRTYTSEISDDLGLSTKHTRTLRRISLGTSRVVSIPHCDIHPTHCSRNHQSFSNCYVLRIRRGTWIPRGLCITFRVSFSSWAKCLNMLAVVEALEVGWLFTTCPYFTSMQKHIEESNACMSADPTPVLFRRTHIWWNRSIHLMHTMGLISGINCRTWQMGFFLKIESTLC